MNRIVLGIAVIAVLLLPVSTSAQTPALAKLERDAQKALTSGPFSVVTKTVTPPSGDKHDYMSQAPYFWPDPKSPNGCLTFAATANAIRRSTRSPTIA
ncbi:MAG TPA: hypothetical protein VF075_14270 [Pyrinomonadaceae bacterium]